MLIALYSYGQRAGKNTAALYIAEWCIDHKISFVETSFAAKGKMLAALALGHSAADEGDWEHAIAIMDEMKLYGSVGWSAINKTPAPPYLGGREFIINLLEGARKLFGRDFWTEQMMRDMPDPKGIVMVTDLRRDWEADSIHMNGGIVVEIHNPRAVNAGTRVEEGIPKRCIDYRIDNTGSLVDFKIYVHQLMGLISSRR